VSDAAPVPSLRGKLLLIFDLDGTLVDSSPLHARAFEEAFAPHGVMVDYGTIAGMTTASAVERVAAGAGLQLDEEEKARLIGDKRARALRLIENELTPIAGAVEFVRAARPRFRLALCTSASRRGAEAALSRVGLTGCFDPVVTAEDVREGKPAPEAFLRALEAHGVPAGDALVFEDAESGLAAAAAAGIEAVRIDPADPSAVSWTQLLAALDEARP